MINYTYARTRPILDRLKKAGDIDKSHGARVRYANPINGGPVLPTMGASLALLPKGFKGEKYRATDGTIFVCTEGGGTTKVEDEVLEWGPNDVFVVPPWKRYSHHAPQRVGAVLDLRPARAGSARHLARGQESKLRLNITSIVYAACACSALGVADQRPRLCFLEWLNSLFGTAQDV